MSDALATLPWVEQGSIHADRSNRMVTFGINDESQFSMDELRQTLGPRYGKGIEVVGDKPHADKQSRAEKKL